MSIAIFVLTLDEIIGVNLIMPQVKKEWAEQIVFVDGGSTDGTVEKAKELGYDEDSWVDIVKSRAKDRLFVPLNGTTRNESIFFT